MSARKIKTKLRLTGDTGTKLGGWFLGKDTYLRIGDKDGHCLGVLDGAKLLRLAKAIVRQFEEGER